MPDALSVTGVSVELGGRAILDDVGFALAPGGLTGLIGSNGAGKTTLLRVILGLQNPTQGTVTVAMDGRRRSIGRDGRGFSHTRSAHDHSRS